VGLAVVRVTARRYGPATDGSPEGMAQAAVPATAGSPEGMAQAAVVRSGGVIIMVPGWTNPTQTPSPSPKVDSDLL
jgi:hypothetical protein